MQSPIEFLNEEFQKRHQRNPNFSLRAFAKYLEISPAQLSQMMSGRRQITFKSLNKIGHRLGLSPMQRKGLLAKHLYDGLPSEATVNKEALRLREDQFRVLADWYHFAILSLTRTPGAKADSRWLARRLGIKPEQASRAVDRLVRMGILQIDPVFQQICRPMEVVSEIPSGSIRKYHKQCLALAAAKLETVPVKYREFQSLNINLSIDQLGNFRSLVDQFLETVSSAAERRPGDEVYQMNVQLIPVTTIHEEKS